MTVSGKDRILLLGGKQALVPAIAKAHEMGLFVILADGNPESPGLLLADRGVICDISAEDKVVALAERERVQGVLALSEFGVTAAAQAAVKLGLPGIDVLGAKRARDKWLMRTAWAEAGLPQPRFRMFRNALESQQALAEIGIPAICKPCMSSAARGVTRITTANQLEKAARQALAADPAHQAIIEENISGLELSCEAFIVDQQLSLLALADKDVDHTSETCVTWSLTYPSYLWEREHERIESLLQQAAQALGITQGCCHAEVFYHDGEFYLLEMAARGGGGYIYTMIVDHVSGVDYVRASINCAIGRPPSVVPTRCAAACYRFLKAPPGHLHAIYGVEESLIEPLIRSIGFAVRPGDHLGVVSNGAERPGWIVAMGETRDEVLSATEVANGKVRFEVDCSQ